MPSLNWIGKDAVVKHHKDVPYRLLEPVPELSAGDTASGNLIVQGDNLHALKALLPRYAGQIRCIYIDPPYNTGTEEWVYNDNVSSPEIRKWLGEVVGKEGETLDRHDRWLCMMYPRLVLLRQFLSTEGVLLVSLDDNESGYARILLDEIYGASNFIAQLIWEKGRKNDAKHFSTGHEYMLVYAMSKIALTNTTWRAPKDGITEIAAAYHRNRAEFGDDFDSATVAMTDFYKSLPKDHPAKKYARGKNIDARGVWRDNNIGWHGGGGPRYDLLHPITGLPCKVPDDGWRFVEETMRKKIAEGWVVFRTDHTKPPLFKSYIYLANESEGADDDGEGKKEVLPSVFYRHSQPASDIQKDIFGGKVFPNPKDHEILSKLIQYVTNDDKNCLVLDSFGGSGSTAHSVLALNSQDGGNRKFLLVEMNEEIAQNLTAERVRRVSQGYVNAKGMTVAGLASGFQFCKLSAEPLFTPQGQIRGDVSFAQLAEFVWFAETGTGHLGSAASPLLGEHEGRAIYLLYNGILKDKSLGGGNVLTSQVYDIVPPFDGPKTIYAAACRLGAPRLQREQIVFKQTPYALEV